MHELDILLCMKLQYLMASMFLSGAEVTEILIIVQIVVMQGMLMFMQLLQWKKANELDKIMMVYW
jgi:ABC-type enterochelin transport system permease subunit